MVDKIDKFYQAPNSKVVITTADNTDKIWRQSSAVVVTRETIWPRRCIKCNTPTDKSLNRSLAYVNPWIYLSLLINVLLTLILALIFQKKFKMEIPVCDRHITIRKRVILVNWILFLVLICGTWLTASDTYNQGWMISSLALLLMLAYGLFNRFAYVSKYKEPYIYVRGAKSEFLDSLDAFQQDS